MAYDDADDSSLTSGQNRNPRKKAKELEKRKSNPPPPSRTDVTATKSPPAPILGGRKTTGLTVDPPTDSDPKATVSTTTETEPEETGTKESEEKEPGVSLEANPSTVPKKTGGFGVSATGSSCLTNDSGSRKSRDYSWCC